MMVASISDEVPPQNPRRRPLLPSEKDNGAINPNPNSNSNPRRPKARQVSSRYMSPSPSTSTSTSNSNANSLHSTSNSSSRRCVSPLISRNSTPTSNIPASSLPKRSVSVDRRRPVNSRPSTPDLVTKMSNGSEMSAATRLLVTSTRSLSVSFQGEAFLLPISKTKAPPPSPNLSNSRKGTPERRRGNTPVRGKVDGGGDQVENSRPIDQHRWPGRIRQENPLSRSLDCSNGERSKVFGSGSVIRALKQSMNDDGGRRASVDGRLRLDLGNNAKVFKAIQQQTRDGNLVNESSSLPFEPTASDTDSVSSGSTSEVQESARGRTAARGIAVSARFWQETNTRLRRLNDPGSPMSKMVVPPKFGQSKKFPTDSNSPLSTPRTMSSPMRGGVRPASPSKLMTSSMASSSPSRGIVSPSRVRSSVAGTISSNLNGTPSVLSFAVDVRRGKVGENRIIDAHLLRLLYNRHLQWRFVNARSEAAAVVQKHGAEKNMWNAWITISDLRDSVTKKRHRLQLLKQKLKLASILRGQITRLEDWASLDKDLSISLVGAIEALKASTLRLPVGGGAIADIQSMKDAISSAFDVMQAVASSIYAHLSKVEEVNSLVAELAKATAKERALLQQCTDFLSLLAAKQVKNCSLRTHMLQLNRVPST
ncbi:hypothetical protein LguiA_008679 [Lonicera macranthoides]